VFDLNFSHETRITKAAHSPCIGFPQKRECAISVAVPARVAT
jgi:hypothetical protein